MKNKWLIGLLTVALAVTTCLGIVACGGGADDAEIAKKAIDTVNVLYGDAEKNTPDDYQVIGVTKVDDETYTIDWSVSPDSAKEYAKVGALDESSKMVTIDITRTTADVEYTLKASVTVGEATESVEFARKIPKKSSEESVTATLDFSAKDNRTTYDSDNNEQVWKQNGITLTNTGNVGDYTNPVRLYKNTTVSIEMENARIIHIDFHSAQGYDDSPYPEYLKTSLENSDLPIKGDITVSEDGLTLGVDFETPQEVVTFKTTAGQCRLTSIDVEAIERSADEHVHNWTYEHIANTWTHKATCTAEGCDVKTKTEDCTPKLNVCACGYTYTAKEIVDALFALEKDESLRGTYTLTGVITKVTEVDTNTYKNATFEMTVEGQTVTVYRAKGSHYAEGAVGGTATVNGELLDYNGTKEFTQGASVVEFVPGVDERTPDQKADAALEKLAATLTVSKTGETVLPVSSEAGVTFTWATSATLPEGTAFEGGKLTVTALPAADTAIEFTVTATIEGATQTHTKTVTVTIKAESVAAEGFTPITAPAAGSDYYLAMDINGTWYYSTGAMSSHYLGTTTEISKAAKVTVASSGSGWTLFTNGKYIEIEQANGYNNIVLNDAQTAGKVWDWDAEHAVFTMTVGSDTFFMGTYGTFTTFNASYVSYLEQDNEYIGKIGTYSGEVTPPAPSDADATISFDDVANRTEVSTQIQVWKQNGITLTNEKADSTSDINEKYYAPLRLYKSTSVKIEYTSAITKIVFHCNSADYASTLQSSLAGSGATVTVDGTNVTVILATPSTTFEFSASAGQIRLDSIDVYTGEAEPEPGPGGDTDEDNATLSFGDEANRTEITTDEEIWVQNGITLTKKIGTGSAIDTDNKYFDPLRIYKNHIIKIEYTSAMTMIVFHCNTTAYANTLQSSLADSGDTVTVDGMDVTVILATPSTTFEFTATAGQIRVNSLDVYTGEVEPSPDPDPDPEPEPEGPFHPITAPVAGNNYYMGMKAQDGQYHYLTGAMNGYYMATTTDIAGAKKVILAGNDTDGWTLVLDGKYIEIEISGSHINAVYKATQTAGRVWQWDTQYNIFVQEISGTKYFLGTYGTYVTVGGGNYDTHASSNWKAVLGTHDEGSSTEPEPTPAPQGDLSLTSENLFAGVEGNGYASYNGEHSVDGYTVDTNQVMGNSYTSASYKVLQFQASKGTLTVEGNFSKITLIIVATSSFDELALPQVKAGENVLEAKLVKTETPEGVTVKSGDDNLPVYLYTVEYTVTGTGVQTITIAKTTKLALYLTSIKFTAAADAPAALLPGKND